MSIFNILSTLIKVTPRLIELIASITFLCSYLKFSYQSLILSNSFGLNILFNFFSKSSIVSATLFFLFYFFFFFFLFVIISFSFFFVFFFLFFFFFYFISL